MKSNTDTVQKKVTLPRAGINKVVANYAELADEAEISLLAADVMENARTASAGKEEKVKNSDAVQRSVKADVVEKIAKKAIEKSAEPETEAAYEEPVYVEEYTEPYVEEPQDIYYEEPVYEEEYVEEAPAEVFLAEEEYAEENTEEQIYADEEYLNGEDYSEEEYADTEDYSEESPEAIYYEEDTFMDDAVTPEYTEEPAAEEPVYEEETLAEFLEEQDAQIEQQAAEKAAKNSEPSADASSDTYLGNIIAQDACQYAGWLPYVWAGDSLETGADCSGFTMAVYAKYGILLSHDSEVQSCEGVSVPLSEALPGDIVVYSGHVAMYIGNGQIVHSPTPGQCVTITNVDMMPVLDVRRMIS